MRNSLKTTPLWLLFGSVSLLTLGLSASILAADGSEMTLLAASGHITFSLIPVILMGIGCLIVSRMPRHTVGWLLILLAVLILLSGLAEFVISRQAQPSFEPSLLLYAAAWYAGMSYMLIMVIVLFIALLFPTGRPPSPRWRWLLRYGVLLILLMIVLSTLATEWVVYGDSTTWTLKNPFGLISLSVLETSPLPLLFLGVLVISSMLSVIVRYRRGGYLERQQMKWFLLACGFFVLLILLSSFGGGTWDELDNLTADLYSLFFALGIIAFPIAIGIAILRYQLFDIDVIIRKTVVYTVLTLLLALIYFGTVIILQSLIGRTTGEQSPLIIVLSTLLIAALFSPLRRRIQDVIDRRFFRRKYDAQQVLARFAQTAQDETDTEMLTAELVWVVQETMQPEMINLVLLPASPEFQQAHK